jgi:hypothetical protein
MHIGAMVLRLDGEIVLHKDPVNILNLVMARTKEAPRAAVVFCGVIRCRSLGVDAFSPLAPGASRTRFPVG